MGQFSANLQKTLNPARGRFILVYIVKHFAFFSLQIEEDGVC